MRCSRGQATVDYVALLAVLIVLVTAAGVGFSAAAGAGVVNAVTGQIRHALCVLGGGFCPDLTSRPCPVATMRDTRHLALSLIVFRIDRDRWVLREQMSDGTIRLTVARSHALGVEAAAGARATVTVRGRPAGMTDEARVGAQGVLASGRVFVARDTREAAAFLRALGDGDDPPVAARETFYEGGVRGLATLGIGNSVAGASLRGLAGAMIGGRRDERTGAVTLGVNAGGAGWGAVTIALGGPVATEERAVSLALTLDRRRRPAELSLSATGTLAAGVALPPSLSRVFGGRASALAIDGRGRRFELAARLDLRDPVVAAAWRSFRDDPGSDDAIVALGEAVRDRAHLDLRTYRTSSTATSAAAGIGQVIQVGGEYDHTIESARLLSASSRPAGGLWERRLDCVAS